VQNKSSECRQRHTSHHNLQDGGDLFLDVVTSVLHQTCFVFFHFHTMLGLKPGAQPALHFGGGASLTSSCLFNRGNFFANGHNVLLPANTKSIVYKYTHSAQRWSKKKKKKKRFTTALEAESLVSSEISDSTPYVHAQSNILRIKYTEKTDD